MAVQPSSWSDLPPELLCSIFNRLKYCVDHVRFATVCTAWQTPILESYPDFIPQPPFILLPKNNKNKEEGEEEEGEEEKEEEDDRSMIDITTKQIYTFHLPEARGRWICNSMNNGWLLTVDLNLPHDIHLLNPLSRAQVLLPPFEFEEFMDDGETYYAVEGYIERAIITTSDPHDPDCLVLIIHTWRRDLAYCKPGDEKWTYLPKPDIPLFDIIFYNGKFYGTDNMGNVMQFELIGENLEAVRIRKQFELNNSPRYLVKSLSGDLLVVFRHRKISKEALFLHSQIYLCYTDRVDVFKLEFEKEEWIETEVKSLVDDEALFVGPTGAISLSASKPKATRGNCVYFLDRSLENHKGYCMGVFDLGTQQLELIYPSSQVQLTGRIGYEETKSAVETLYCKKVLKDGCH